MDSSFKQQYLYDPMNTGQYGSSTSLNNLASKSSSRIGSPAVAPSSLKQDTQRTVKSPRGDHSVMQPGTGLGWSTGTPLGSGPASRTASVSQFGPGTDSLGGMSSFASPLSGAYSTASMPYSANGPISGSAFMGSSGGFGGPQQQYGNGQYTSHFGASGQFGGHYGSQYNPQYAYGQYANQYGGGGGGYPGAYGSLNGISTAGSTDSGFYGTNGTDSYASDRKTADTELDSFGPGTFPRVDEAADAGISAKKSSTEGPSSVTGDDNVMQPADVFWHYIDLQGQQQGPFSGAQMNEWMGYMLDVTMVKRADDAAFVPLASLKEATNTAEPFGISASPDEWNKLLSKAVESNEGQQQQADQNGKSKETTPADESPLIAKRPQPVHPAQLAQPSQEAQRVQLAQQPHEVTQPKQALLADAEVDTNPDSHPLRSRESSLAPGDVPPSLTSLKISDNEEKVAPIAWATEERKLEATNRDSNVEKSPMSPRAVSTEPRPPSAVWKKTPVPTSQVSIAELKKQQELEKKQQKKKLAETGSSSTSSRKSSTSRWLPLDQIESTPTPTAQSPVATPAQTTPAATWNTKEVVQTRSLADIQKEQAMKAKGSSNSAASVVGKSVGGSRSPSKPLPQGDSGTRFQALQETQLARSQAPPAATHSPKPRQRSIQQSASQQPTSITSAASAARPTDELVHWARVSFKDLINGIDGMELLDVFLSLPMNNSAKEFIAESIYSYSKTLDGRRFASDFLKMRKLAEESMGPGESWKDVLRRFNPNVVEQDPSFKVVTKKRTGKIARPGDSMRA